MMPAKHASAISEIIAAGGLNLASVSALKNGTSTWTPCISGVLRLGWLVRKNIASSQGLALGGRSHR